MYIQVYMSVGVRMYSAAGSCAGWMSITRRIKDWINLNERSRITARLAALWVRFLHHEVRRASGGIFVFFFFLISSFVEIGGRTSAGGLGIHSARGCFH